ncbi:MAG: gamma-butyrobetaine hydroxylase-like domain-containing protein [Ilumatobacteraceae bacterium]
MAPPVELDETISVTDAALAGAFGINLDWSDGHRTGIYAWTYLRDAFDAGRLGTRVP